MSLSESGPKYPRATMIGAVWIVLLLLIYRFGGLGSTDVAFILLVILSLVTWYGAAYLTGSRLFRYFFVGHKHVQLVQRLHINLSDSKYILVKPRFPFSLTRRFVQTLSVFLLFGSTVSYNVPAGGRNPVAETVPFVDAGILSLIVVMPIVALLWVYEDSGIRRYKMENDTVGRVGTLFEQFLFGSGAFSGFLRLVLSLSAPATQVISWAVNVFILFPPICLAITVTFHRLGQLRLVNRTLAVAAKNGFQQQNIRMV